jgi:3-isopropylmalate dehydrogenase
VSARIVLLPGDGIGPEIAAAGRRLLEALGEFEFDQRLIGGASIDEHGTALTDDVLEACRSCDAVLLAAVGGPKWDTTDPDAPRPEQGLLGLRKGLGLFANLRPVRPSPALVGASPLREEIIAGTDLIVVRELTTTTASTRSQRSSGSRRWRSRPRSGAPGTVARRHG